MTFKTIRHHPIQDMTKSYYERLQISSEFLLNRDVSQVSRTKIETRVQLLNTLINSKKLLVGYSGDFEIVFSCLKTRLEELLSILPSDVEKEPNMNHKWSFSQHKSPASKLINFLLTQQPGVFAKEEIFAEIWNDNSFNDKVIMARCRLQKKGLYFKSLWWKVPFKNNYALYRTDEEFEELKQEFSRKHWVNNS